MAPNQLLFRRIMKIWFFCKGNLRPPQFIVLAIFNLYLLCLIDFIAISLLDCCEPSRVWRDTSLINYVCSNSLFSPGRQKVCCGIIYKGRFGEVLIDTHLFKPCCRNKQPATEKSPPPVPPSSTITNQEEW